MKTWSYRIIAGALLLLSSCTFDYEQCSPGACADGEICVLRDPDQPPSCLMASEIDAASPDAGPAEVPDTASDEDTAPPDPDPDPDPLQCPAFDGCGDDEPNDGLEVSVWLNQDALGCARFDFDDWRLVRQDIACGGDEDIYLLDYVPCEESSFKLTITLETQGQCAGAVLELVDGPHRCADENVRCTTSETGEEIVIIVESTNNPSPRENVYFAVRPLDPDDGVEYVLKTSVER